MKCTNVFAKTLKAYNSNKYRIISNVGSTRSSKTYSILQLLYLISTQNCYHISIVSVNMPHLKRGCIKDFDLIVNEENYAGITDINKSDKKYFFKSGSIIEFFSCDNSGKLRGSQRDILFINECNLISAECYRQLAIRTSKIIFLDYNPTSSFWLEDLRSREDFTEFHSTYKDNNFLSDDQIREIESNKNNEAWWRVYGLGLVGNQEGRCYPKFQHFDKSPEGKVIWGLDFGWNDPCALVRTTEAMKDVYIEEYLYKSKMSAEDIYNVIKDIVPKGELIIADSARPEIIDYLRKKGINIKSAIKGKNSIVEGIQYINGFNIFLKGKNLIREAENYCYEKDELLDKFTDTPIDYDNHLLDAMRYALCFLKKSPNGKYSIKTI